MAALRKFYFSSFWLLAERGCRIAVVLVINVLLARSLGPSDYGLLAYALSIAGIFLTLSSLGLTDILLKEIHDHPGQRGSTMGTGLVLLMFGSFSAALMILGLSLLMKDRSAAIVVSVLAASALFGAYVLFESYLNALVRGRVIAIAKSAQLVLSAGLKLLLIFAGAPLWLLAAAFAFDYLALLLCLGAAYATNGNSFADWRFEKSRALALLRQSWPVLLSGVFITIYMKIDQVMIKYFLGPAQVGNYAVAVQLSQAWYFVPMLISTALFPYILEARSEGAAYQTRLLFLYRLMCMLGLVAALIITPLASSLIDFLFGSGYEDAAPVLQVHIWAGIFVGLGVVSGKWLVSEGLNRHVLYRAVLGGLTNIVLNFVLIPVAGIMGAAVATICSQVIATLLYDLLHPALRHNFVLKIQALSYPNPFRSREPRGSV